MAVKMLTGMAGEDFAVSPGETWEGSAENEARLVAAGLAEPIAAPKTETKKKAK